MFTYEVQIENSGLYQSYFQVNADNPFTATLLVGMYLTSTGKANIRVISVTKQ